MTVEALSPKECMFINCVMSGTPFYCDHGDQYEIKFYTASRKFEIVR